MQKQNEKDEDIKGMIGRIAPCIWHSMSDTQSHIFNFNKPRLETKRIYEKDKEAFQSVFSEFPPDLSLKNKNNYLTNYKLFYNKLSNLQKEGIPNIIKFFKKIAKSLIILPIECNSFEMSLTIFSTLNDRGLPLADHDIFRSYLYQLAHEEGKKEKQEFIDNWNTIEDLCKKTEGKAKTSINNIFQYNMHIIRAVQGKTDNIIGIRPFYLDNTKEHLKKKLLPTLIDIAFFWNYIGTNFTDNKNFSNFFSDKTKKYIQILGFYPNDQWKNILTIAYNEYNKDIEKIILPLVAALYYRFLETKNVTYIKQLCQRMGINIKTGKNILDNISFTISRDIIKNEISTRIRQGLLLLYTYSNHKQDYIDTIEKFDIEYILPKKWKEANYQSLVKDSEEAKNLINSIGNMSFLKKKLNIQAANGYFGQKKEEYKKSRIVELRSIAVNKQEWGKQEIEKREELIVDRLYNFFQRTFRR